MSASGPARKRTAEMLHSRRPPFTLLSLALVAAGIPGLPVAAAEQPVIEEVIIDIGGNEPAGGSNEIVIEGRHSRTAPVQVNSLSKTQVRPRRHRPLRRAPRHRQTRNRTVATSRSGSTMYAQNTVISHARTPRPTARFTARSPVSPIGSRRRNGNSRSRGAWMVTIRISAMPSPR